MKKGGRIKKYERLNQGKDFLERYQRVMLQRMNLNHEGNYSKRESDRIIRNEINQPKNAMDVSIKGGLKFICDIEPEFYLMLQETVKRITGTYLPMNELTHILLTYFHYAYSNKSIRRVMPFERKRPGKRYEKLIKFQNRFGKYYKNRFKSLYS